MHPIQFEHDRLLPVVIFCAWFSLMNITAFAFLVDDENLKLFFEDTKFNFNVLLWSVTATMLFISIAFSILTLSEKEWARLFFLWPVILSIITGILIIKNFSPSQIDWTSVGSFYAIPLVAIILSVILNWEYNNHNAMMITCFLLCLFSSIIFYLKKDSFITANTASN